MILQKYLLIEVAMADRPEDLPPPQPTERLPQPFNLVQAPSKPSRLLDRFVERIKQTFNNKSKATLDGRVHELQNLTAEITQRLIGIRQGLNKRVDGELLLYVQNMVDCLLREERRIEKLMQRPASVIHQARLFKKHREWIEKARLLLVLESKLDDKPAIIDAIVKHTFAEYDSLIDQDLQIINDYEGHILSTLPLSDSEKARVQTLMETRLSTYIHALAKLKDKPVQLELGKVSEWKANVDRNRSKFFDTALHTIDEIIHEIVPESGEKVGQEHLLEVYTQIASLEEDIHTLLKEISGSEVSGQVRKQFLQSRVYSLQNEVHKLIVDLRLTPELFQRLQALRLQLDAIEQELT